jgi:hypothetical protein
MEITVLSEISQPQKDKYHMFSFLRNMWTKSCPQNPVECVENRDYLGRWKVGGKTLLSESHASAIMIGLFCMHYENGVMKSIKIVWKGGM